nr:hypothetical protein Iba_chr01bCG15430 [Ipomoea batatas]GMC52157.1 hypothetical protein Iba_chr01cCG12990 [Ipomoea batatas]GMC54125.1 hypothetical protein Iba_chr01dCG13180 [Ipomoea batatas]GMC54854.1 hypothetical protein Iba_chr01eCG1870 [Ipomoea batatas]
MSRCLLQGNVQGMEEDSVSTPCQYHTLGAQNQKVGQHLLEELSPFPFCEMLVSPIQHLLYSYGYPCQKQVYLSSKEPPIIWCPLHLQVGCRHPYLSSV